MEQYFFERAYEIIETHDQVNIELIKYAITSAKIIRETKKVTIRNILLSQFLKIYHFLINNKVYQEVNKESLKICYEILKSISFLEKFCPNIENINDDELLLLFLKLLECLDKMDEIRIDYLEENGNMGRTIPSSYHLDQIDAILKEQKELQNQLKRALEYKN